jgi:hypothetical protein
MFLTSHSYVHSVVVEVFFFAFGARVFACTLLCMVHRPTPNHSGSYMCEPTGYFEATMLECGELA